MTTTDSRLPNYHNACPVWLKTADPMTLLRVTVCYSCHGAHGAQEINRFLGTGLLWRMSRRKWWSDQMHKYVGARLGRVSLWHFEGGPHSQHVDALSLSGSPLKSVCSSVEASVHSKCANTIGHQCSWTCTLYLYPREGRVATESHLQLYHHQALS